MQENNTSQANTIVVKNVDGCADSTAVVVVQNNILNEPKISVIIPVYNVEEYIGACLDSILNQTLEDIEVVCVDDGSTDNSMEILKEYAAKDKRITVLQQQNMFAGVARNAGIAVAKGKYLHFMDSDDLLYNRFVYENLWHTAEEHDFCKIIRGRGIAIDGTTGKYVYNKIYENANMSFSTYDAWLNVLKNTANAPKLSVVPWMGIVRRDFVLANDLRFNNLRCCNDRSFFMSSIVAAEKIFLSSLVLVKHRVNNSGSLRGIRDQFFDCHFKSIQTTYDFLRKRHVKKEVLNEIVSGELSDMCVFFQKFLNTSDKSYDIYLSTIAFLRDFGISQFKPQIKKYARYTVMKKLSKRKTGNRLTFWWDKHFLAKKSK